MYVLLRQFRCVTCTGWEPSNGGILYCRIGAIVEAGSSRWASWRDKNGHQWLERCAAGVVLRGWLSTANR